MQLLNAEQKEVDLSGLNVVYSFAGMKVKVKLDALLKDPAGVGAELDQVRQAFFRNEDVSWTDVIGKSEMEEIFGEMQFVTPFACGN